MSVSELLDHIFLQPLTVLYQTLFASLLSLTHDAGVALVLFGLSLNLLLLPIYFQMEQAGQAYRHLRGQVEREVGRLKRHFTGRELFYYTQTAHRQHKFHPFSAVLNSGDLLIQVLIFATVFRFLVHHPALEHRSFLGITDLSRSDGLLFGFNLLPLLMTLANVGSALVYGNDRTKRLSSIGLALLFLILLYASPSGLVLYWTINNLFSLFRNLIAKILGSRLPTPLVSKLSALARQQ